MNSEKTDHDLLIQLSEDMEWVRKALENHIHSHFQYSLAAWGSVAGLLAALILLLIKS